jgi:GNAT superfamily N-acetyltransferase
VAWRALREFVPRRPVSEAERARLGQARIAHVLRTDPGGAWVAEADGEVVGIALALMREGIWGLSLFAVAPERQGEGIGRRLLDASLAYGDDARGRIILATPAPAALRRYARAGFELRPCVAAAGVVDRRALPATPRVREAGAAGIEVADAIGRAVRGAGHGPDLPQFLETGCRLLTCEDRGFVAHRGGNPVLLAATDDATAAELLWAALAAAPDGGRVEVDFLTAGQDWAVRVALDAGLSLQPDGPMFVTGELGPLRPYIPSGAYL